ncbi:hypothetical protein EJB05_18990, partial [Eragrostis curvula]
MWPARAIRVVSLDPKQQQQQQQPRHSQTQPLRQPQTRTRLALPQPHLAAAWANRRSKARLLSSPRRCRPRCTPSRRSPSTTPRTTAGSSSAASPKRPTNDDRKSKNSNTKTGTRESISYVKVYDVTKFLEDHPGGDDVLLSSTAKDATDDFEDVGHSTTARAMMDEYLVGEIDATTIPTKVKYTPPKQPHYNQDKTPEFVIKILQFLVPLAILGLAVAVRIYTKSESA